MCCECKCGEGGVPLLVKLAGGAVLIALIAGPVIAFLAIVIQVVAIMAGLAVITVAGLELAHRDRWRRVTREARVMAIEPVPAARKRVAAQRMDRPELPGSSRLPATDPVHTYQHHDGNQW